MSTKKLWLVLTMVLVVSFGILGGYGFKISSMAPPVPVKVQTPDGKVVFTKEDIQDGQNVWQSIGGQEVGTVWGHGSYVAPDWSADWLHRELVYILNQWAKAEGTPSYDQLSDERKGALKAKLKHLIRTNTYNPQTRTLTIDPIRAEAIQSNSEHYADVFSNGYAHYAIPKGALSDPEQLHRLNAFFFWTAWACGTNRPDLNISYTQNWPHEELIDNRPTGGTVVWSVISFVLLLAGIGGMVWYFASEQNEEELGDIPKQNPMLGYTPTPSQKATIKYFFVVAALLVVQIIVGIITAHYGVEGSGFYGIPLDRWLPYAVTRTWHLQLGIFWIATAWLATGLYMGPAVGGKEPKGQRFLVNVLFVALLIIVVGSLTGEWLSIERKLHGDQWFWFGTQGYEYIDLGRFWQLFLLTGLFIWLFLMVRSLLPALKKPGEHRSLLTLFVISCGAIALFYSAGLGIWKHTHLAMAEYWRWWVVHLWVEGFFEVFATVVIAFIFSRLKLVKTSTVTTAVLFSTIVYLSGGIIGTFHHLYFAGTPSVIMAFGAVFSALEVVPLVLVGFEAWENIRHSRVKEWVSTYRWAIYYFVAVAFWNLVGAGLFGFFINPPIALYYMQGLNTTAVHAHTALFGVYGMLGIGLMLFCLRGLLPGAEWKTGILKFSFWAINIGLMMMVLLSLLPMGLMQTWASVDVGTWYARSDEFLHIPIMQTLRWLRIPGDTLFGIGVLALGWFMIGLLTGHSFEKEGKKITAGEIVADYGK